MENMNNDDFSMDDEKDPTAEFVCKALSADPGATEAVQKTINNIREAYKETAAQYGLDLNDKDTFLKIVIMDAGVQMVEQSKMLEILTASGGGGLNLTFGGNSIG